jgi:hypothetical protein
MDPIEVREERVATGAAATPVAGAPVAAAPVAPAAVAPVAAAPAVATGGVYASRTGVYPVGYRSIQIVWLVIGIVNVILALDFVFNALGAHNTGFAHYIYRIGGLLATPFDGIFSTTRLLNGTSVLIWADLLAILVYSLVGWAITKIIRISATPRTGVTRA